jgi:actin-related protein 5
MYEGIDNSWPVTLGRARIHLSIERWRVCETWFAPSMAGVDSAGLGEVLQNVLASFSTDDRGLLVQVRYPTLPSSLSVLVFRTLTLTLTTQRNARTCS